MKYSRIYALTFISIAFILGSSISVPAQLRDLNFKTFVFSSPKGMYVLCGFQCVSPVNPIGDTVGYRVERRVGKEAWKHIADVSSVSSLDAYRTAVGEEHVQSIIQKRKFRDPDDLWKRIVDSAKIGRLWYMNTLPDLRALGFFYLDESVTKGQKYEYRVSVLLRSGATVKPKTSPATEFGTPWQIGTMRITKTESTDSSVILEWTTRRIGHPAASVRVFRRFTGDEQYTEMKDVGIAYLRSDSVVVTVHDKDLLPSQEYRYYVIPMDFYENTGPESDGATIYTVNFTRLPLPQYKRATPDSMGVRLTWKSEQFEHVMATRIYRGLSVNGPFERIAEVPARDTMYLDITAEGMTTYYYKMSNVTYDNRESQLSPAFFGHYVSLFPPITPQGFTAKPVKDGIELKWIKNPERDIAGYYILRAASEKDSLLPVSPLLKDTMFVDTSALLRPYIQYRYAVIARNTSELKSHPSNEEIVRPIIATNPQPPRELDVRKHDFGFSIIWNDPREYDQYVVGYVLYRGIKKGADIDWKILSRIDDIDKIMWLDSSVVAGTTYSYAVSSVDVLGAEGVKSKIVEAFIPLPVPPTPLQLHTNLVDGVVVIEWDEAPAEAVSSMVLYRRERGKNFEKLATVKQSQSSFEDKSVVKGTVYYYALAYVNNRGIEGAKSREVYVVVR